MCTARSGCASSNRNNALYQGAAVGRAMAARPSTDDSVPYFWSDQYDVKLQMFGRPVVDQP
jgi:3-phenylpropionate/trans-cinnamate dioxygenase ferredoxin reductase subunit